MKRPSLRILTLAVLLGGGMLAHPPGGGESRAAPSRGTPPTVEALAAQLVLAIHKNDVELAMKLFPTLEEFRQAGVNKNPTEQKHASITAKARKRFAMAVDKFKRKNREGCKSLVFSRVKLGRVQQLGNISLYDSIDVFAKCDGREIFVADPDGVHQATGGWRLLDFI